VRDGASLAGLGRLARPLSRRPSFLANNGYHVMLDIN
jgi:hypothetical protein